MVAPDADASLMGAGQGETKAVLDDLALLSLLVRDTAQSGPPWTATSYWQGYRDRILRELANNGLAKFRSNQILLASLFAEKFPKVTQIDGFLACLRR